MNSAILILCLALLAVTSSAANVKSIFFLHRHGSRLPGIVKNNELNWNDAQMTQVGLHQMEALGTYLNAKYSGKPIANQDETIDVTKVYTRSTDYDRTRQSASAVLSKIFTKPLHFPIILYVKKVQELAMRVGWPTFQLHDVEGKALAQTDKEVLADFGQTQLDEIGKSIGEEALCKTQPGNCILLAQDKMMCDMTNTGACDTVCKKHILAINNTMARYYHRVHAWLNNDAYQAQIGSFGYVLAKEMYDKSASAYTYAQYSGHDSTMVAFLSLLGVIKSGDLNSTYNVPYFGQTVLLEFMDDDTINFQFGYPNQGHADKYEYTFTPLPVNCMVDKVVTKASTCSKANWGAYLATQAPKSADGVCYADPADVTEQKCAEIGTAPTSPCKKFRTLCPDQACPAGSVLDTVDDKMICNKKK